MINKTMINKRHFILSAGAMVGLSGCFGPPNPTQVTLSLVGSSGMNPGPDGSDRPVVVSVLQLRSLEAFNAADFFALQNPSAALGGDLVGAEQVAVSTDSLVTKLLAIEQGVAFVGIVAAFRSPGGKKFRTSVKVVETKNVAATVNISASGVSAG